MIIYIYILFQCLGNFCVSHRSTGRVEFTYGSRCVAAFDQAVKKKKSLGNREEEDEEIEGLSEEIPRKLIPTGYEPNQAHLNTSLKMMSRRVATPEELAKGQQEMKEAEERMIREGIEVIDPRRGERGVLEEFLISPTATPQILGPTAVARELQDGETGSAVSGGLRRGSEAESGEGKSKRRGASEEGARREVEDGWIGIDPRPTSSMIPLFNEDQIRQLDQVYSRGPLLHRSEAPVERPGWLKEEEEKQLRRVEERERSKEEMMRMTMMREFQQAPFLSRIHELEREKEEVRRGIRILEKENEEVRRANEEIRKSNETLRREFEVLLKESRGLKDRMRLFGASPYGTPDHLHEEAVEPPEEAAEVREEFGGKKKEDEDFGKEWKKPWIKTEEDEYFRTPGEEGGSKKEAATGSEDQSLMVKSMLKLMEGMHVLQTEIMNVKKTKDLEVVKGFVGDLQKLPEWRADSAPLDLTDWLLAIGPQMGDLSDNSQMWWEQVLSMVKEWYHDHMELSPLERVNHQPKLPKELQEVRYQRLEKRATALLMQAIPVSQQEDVIAGKEVTVVSILSRLMLSYQPGGLSEKSAILAALDSPEEAQSLAAAVIGLRKWLRWHRRAGEVGVTRPDATIQARGLSKLMRKVLRDNQDLGFRISLAKSSLHVDTTPTESSVMTFAHHLLAETEQIAHQDRKKKTDQGNVMDAKAKRMEEQGYGKGDGKSGGKGGEKGGVGNTPCKFYLSEEGCKKGKLCGWLHQGDEKRRCWTCGSTQHFAPACERPKEAAEKGGKSEGKGFKSSKVLKKEADDSPPAVEGASESSKSEAGGTDVMKELLVEANKMIKGLAVKNGGEASMGRTEEVEDGRLEAMQKQIDELRKIRVLRLTKLEKFGSRMGLLDSGATHALRGCREGEELSEYEEVLVTLANGEKVPMKMSSSGVMISPDPQVEPIVPLGFLGGALGYSIRWAGGVMTLVHPKKGKVTVKVINGCPQVPRRVALEMIEEIEKGRKIEKMEVGPYDKEKEWLNNLVEAHPILKELPDWLRSRLPDLPDCDLRRIPGCNRRKRKKMQGGFVAHLYAGEKEGYDLGRAFKEVGGDANRLVEIDTKRDQEGEGSHDMLRDEGVYSALLRAAIDGMLVGLVMGPNCRTRSVLRHYPLDVPGGGPKPLRSWKEPWGKSGLERNEERKVQEDDVLMWRGIFLFIVAEEIRKATEGKEVRRKMRIGLEQPADPKSYKPEVVSFWSTEEWRRLKEMYSLEEQTFNQSSWGGRATKPTTFGGNLSLRLPEEEGRGFFEGEAVKDSKELSRWAPGMMREVAVKIQKEVFGSQPVLRVLSWSEHVRQGHVPFRRDCQVCQEAAGRSRAHHRVSHPRAGVLNLDVAGPLRPGNDLEETAKFMLLGTCTWLKPRRDEKKEEKKQEEREEGDGAEEDVEEEGPMLEAEEEEIEAEEEEKKDEAEDVEVDQQLEGQPEERKDQLGEEEKILPDIEVIQVGIPVRGKTKDAVLEGIAELYLQLRTEGYPIHTVHTDRGREFVNGRVKNWMKSRNLHHSTNSGEDPKANGRVERAVGLIKSRVRRLLHGASMDVKWWPMALRYAIERDRLERRGEGKSIPPFGSKVLVKKRNWRTKMMEATHEETTYLAPVAQAHGHCVLRANGRWGVAPYVIKNIQKPPPLEEEMWLALVHDVEKDEVEERRRIRGKGPRLRKEQVEALMIKKMLKEESSNIEEDTLENAMMMFKKMEILRMKIKKIEEEEQEVLQTKIVSPMEMMKDIGLWNDAIQSELDSLLYEKKALRTISEEEKHQIEVKNKDVMVVPSKLVITRKAGGRRKVRIVACGNYIEKGDSEDLYAGGSDSISMRLSLKKAMIEGWTGASMDIKTAFLNAPLSTEEDGAEGPVVILKPPNILVKLGYVKPSSYWKALMAMYGLRQSPRTWSDHRDECFLAMTWKVEQEEFYFEPMTSEPNLWKVMKKEEIEQDVQTGLMLVYVDDLLVLSEERIVRSVIETISSQWEVSEPEWLNAIKPTKFLGVEIWELPEGIFVNQEKYLMDVLRRNGQEEGLLSGIPITKDQVQRLEEEDEEKTLQDVRQAQRATGEFMWMVTRSRPDLMFALSKMSQSTLRSPKEVLRVAEQVWKYLRKTRREGLWFRREGGENLEVFTDSSYGPNGLDSQGCVVVKFGGDAVMWKSGKQTVPSLSTAESELGEAIEGLTMGDSIDVLIQEISQRSYVKKIKVGNTAAVSLLTESAGSWRTRHLRLRAAHLRWRLGRLDWLVESISGEEQVADVGTKVLSSPRLETLKEMMMMGKVETKEEKVKKEEERKEEAKEPKKEGYKKEEDRVVEKKMLEEVFRMIAMLAMIQGSQAQEEEQGEEDGQTFWIAVIVVMILCFTGLWAILCGVWRLCSGRRSEGEKAQPEEEPDLEEEVEQREEEAQEDQREEEMPSSSLAVIQRGGLRRRPMKGKGKGKQMIDDERRAEEPEPLMDVGEPEPLVVVNRWEPRDQRNGRRGPAFITTYGTKWHQFTTCGPLAQRSHPLVSSRWCQECSRLPRRDFVPVYGSGRGGTVHYDQRCGLLEGGSRCFLKCAICHMMEPNP